MITKKIMGIGFASIGVLGVLGSFTNDLLNLSDYQGVGPQQRLAIIGASALILVGLSLLPFGDNPA